jgi:Fic family protein
MKYVWQLKQWPKYTWDWEKVNVLLGACRKYQGIIEGKLSVLGGEDKLNSRSKVLVEEALQTSAIEGVQVNIDLLRSSVARHLGMKYSGTSKKERSVDGLVEMLLDATEKYSSPINAKRLFGWHASLFPTGYSGVKKIKVGLWRTSPMFVVSGYVGKETIHYEAPAAEHVSEKMQSYFKWWKTSQINYDGLIRAAIAHLYFVQIHPFEDGNGRIARALTDMTLAQDEKNSSRYYSMSSEIITNRLEYYRVLEKAGKGNLEITAWISWFLETLKNAMHEGNKSIEAITYKLKFWQKFAQVEINQRQRKVVSKMLEEEPEGFKGGMTTKKYVGVAKTSRATASRELSDLVVKGLLISSDKSGRSTSYHLSKK